MTKLDLDEQGITEVLFGDARGGRRPASQVEVEVIRALTSEDAALLSRDNALVPLAGANGLTAIRHTHHRLAKLLASGMPQVQAAQTTGYSQAYISSLHHDPAFKELLAYYAERQEELFADVQRRMTDLGISALDEIQDRLATAPNDWSRRELMELAEMMLIKSSKGPDIGQRHGGVEVSIAVKFVTPLPSEDPATSRGPLIDAEANR